MSETTQIDPEKVRAYVATDYRFGDAGEEIVLKIGKRSDQLAILFARHRVDCGAFLTAYNPQGRPQSAAANDLGHAELAQLLRGKGLKIIEGAGSEDGSDWPEERSWFALGLALSSAKELGNRFAQDAIVWVGPDAIPQLILLR